MVTVSCNSTYRLRYWNFSKDPALHLGWLQQYLPFTVLKRILQIEVVKVKRCNSTYRLRYWNAYTTNAKQTPSKLQQYLPFTVLKQMREIQFSYAWDVGSCNSTYRLRYWNISTRQTQKCSLMGCNSTYRLRYWNYIQSLLNPSRTYNVATVLTVYGIETIDSNFLFCL